MQFNRLCQSERFSALIEGFGFFCSNATLASKDGLSVREHAAAILVMRGHAGSSNDVV